jgi:hypothetical protein
MASTYKVGTVITLEEWLTPLKESFTDILTKEFKKSILNKDLHVVVLTNKALEKSGTTNNSETRAAAYDWIINKSQQSSELKEYNKKQRRSQFVVCDSFGQVGRLFSHLRSIKKIKSAAGLIHRGHVKAGVRLQAEYSLDKLSNVGAVPEGVGGIGGVAASNKIKKELRQLARRLTPALTGATIRRINDKTANFEGKLIFVFPELGKDNLGKVDEKTLRNKFNKVIDKFIKDHGSKVIQITGSKNYIQAVDTILDEVIAGRKKRSNFSGRKKTKVWKPKIPIKTPKVALLPKLRDKKGRFTSPLSIQTLLQSRISTQVAENMGEAGALEYRTGRFAESVVIMKVTRQKVLTAYYTYMKYPYQTFERGFAQGSLKRDPRVLISKSIREIAAGIVNERFNVRRV